MRGCRPGFDTATPIEESPKALNSPVKQSLVRYIGVSNRTMLQITTALGIPDRLNLARFASVQANSSTAGRDLKREIALVLNSAGRGPVRGGVTWLADDLTRAAQPRIHPS